MFRSVHADPSRSGDPNADFPVLIDHDMDLELVYWAARASGHLEWIDTANSHLSKVIQNMIRPDGGTYQFGFFNAATGAFVHGQTRQGYADNTTWSRGESWLLYTLANAYAETGRVDFSRQRRKSRATGSPASAPTWSPTGTSTPPRLPACSRTRPQRPLRHRRS
jgi:hypothetical protein